MANDFVFIIMDKQPAIRRILSRFLREMALNDEINRFHKILEAQDAPSALELFESIVNRNILGANDISMPFNPKEVIVLCEIDPEDSDDLLGGVELFKRCMGNDNFYEFSFIMMFDNPTMEAISEVGELGAIDILVKPLTFNSLSRVIRKVQEKINSGEQALFKNAERLIEKKEYIKALDLIAESEQRFPGLKWVILRGRAHLGLSDARQAEDAFRSAKISAHIASVLALRNLAEVYEVTGEVEKSIETLNELTRKSPKNLDRRLRLAELLTEADRQGEAKEVLDSMAKMNLNLETQTVIANMLEKSGYEEDAANLRVKSIGQNLNDYVLCNRMAIELRKQGKHEKAESCYQEIIAVHPEQRVIWFNRGINFGAWGNTERDIFLLEKARDCFRTVLKIDPKYTAAIDMLNALQDQVRKLIREKRQP
jgi:tetratricopeptide (TPR) repeat protein